jgi:hypothetical protein
MVSSALHKTEASIAGTLQDTKLRLEMAQKRAAVSGGF